MPGHDVSGISRPRQHSVHVKQKALDRVWDELGKSRVGALIGCAGCIIWLPIQIAAVLIAVMAALYGVALFGDACSELGSALHFAVVRFSHRYEPSLWAAEARGFWEGVWFGCCPLVVTWPAIRGIRKKT
jgi:hypothetical protein